MTPTRARTWPPIGVSCDSRSTRRRGATGMAAACSAVAASRSSSATSIGMGCSGASSARRTSSPGCMARTRARCWRQKRTPSRSCIFDSVLAPLFDRRLVRWLTSKKTSLYGLGIPPAQYRGAADGRRRPMAFVLRERLERLACAFPLEENYFAWQAFGAPLSCGLRRARCLPICGARISRRSAPARIA